VAIKVLHPAYTSNTDIVQRFEREAQAAGRIGNDHILEILDMGELPDGSHFMVMEYLEGETLAARIKRFGRMQPRDVAALFKQILAGLAAAHGAGIVHRDLKPENIFILKEKAGKTDYVKIIDFGISKFQPLSGDGMKMTRTGAVMGTPYYMSPEQASGSRDADARSDLYAVGVMVYEAVTGCVPYDAPTFNQLMFKIVLSEPPPAQAIVPDLDPAFASIIAKGMARDVHYRFQSAAEFTAAIDGWLERGTPVTIPPTGGGAELPAGIGAGAGRVHASQVGTNASAAAPTRATGTAGTLTPSLAASQPDTAPKKSPAALIAVAGIGVVVVLGAIAAFALSRKSEAGAAPSAAAAAIAAPSATPVAAPPPPPPIPTPAPTPSAAPAASEKPSEPTESTKRVASTRSAPRTSPRTAPAPKAGPQTKTAPKGGGTPDFGY
jgi:serine/threonine-protein kinase